jgi:hypothetical protein
MFEFTNEGKKMAYYKNIKLNPKIGDIVLQGGREVIVKEVRMNPKLGFSNCSFGDKLILDTPWTFDFIRRG